ncbi:hypothetical protein PF005_g23600 [Phytophthora fragariae]|uniref:FYVE-type domain-containing protein n=1 Tax=Phytophthora fragariae TaxID=53985 RepID=A0A6A3RLJ0_9STRA|nr:hypothetical protein PF003_g5959 [Phytophthora fragariae]KAE8925445.1 hypothetical protein PF009_g24346 [Phytophthora fragariae]KAE9078929.1 hypothetical protein PF010_g22948 [Phytophthora fragariae]KAE9079029.1 hypothetical protein PF007_g23614 [Phytophthora fragariae]KAE9099848.1 hypothetical protein PF006_g23042 [Phytophthora fragariae]
MRQSSGGPASALLGASESSSNVSGSSRKVRLSDRELFQRVQRVAVPAGPVDLSRLSPRRGWKRVRVGVSAGMAMHFRVRRTPTPTAPFEARQCQVAVGGELHVRASELLSLLRAPTESESNALLRALYGSRFIYSSLLHAVPNSERGSLPSPPNSMAESMGQQLMVRTSSFAHTGLSNPFKQRPSTASGPSDPMTSDSRNSLPIRQTTGARNEQCCYIELLTPTPHGLKMAFCTLDAAEVTAGKAPPERVIALHPLSGWLTAEPKRDNPDTLEITFQASFTGNVPGGCDSRVAQARLLFLAKGVSRLEKVLRRRRCYHRQQRRTGPARLWQRMLNPFRALGVVGSDEEASGGTHHNWHCIACTRSLLPTLRKKWSRCDLCAYRVCSEPPCCSQEQVAIYNRYVAPLLVCARCRECIDERDSPNRGSGNPLGSGAGDIRYTGVSLRFADRESELEPELELDPAGHHHDRWGTIETPSTTTRSAGGLRMKRRTQSDPAPMLDLAFSSSGEDDRSSGAEPAPNAHTNN